jgi:hypothetical protein
MPLTNGAADPALQQEERTLVFDLEVAERRRERERDDDQSAANQRHLPVVVVEQREVEEREDAAEHRRDRVRRQRLPDHVEHQRADRQLACGVVAKEGGRQAQQPVP